MSIPIVEVKRGGFDPNFDHYPVIFVINCSFQRDSTLTYQRKESAASWKKFKEILKQINIIGNMPSHKDGLSGKELVNKISEYIVEKLTYANKKTTPLVRSKLPPIGGFLTRTTLRHLAHARRLYRTLVKTVDRRMRAGHM